MSIRAAIKHVLKRFVTVVEFCRDCGVRQPIPWQAKDALWLEIMGRPGGVLCPTCFHKRCQARGISLYWYPVVEHREAQP